MCRSCGAGGGVIDLAKRLGVELPELKPAHVEDYVYQNADGSHAYTVSRFRPKTFTMQIAEGVNRVLYHLPELTALERGSTVFFVEGERDVEVLRLHGLNATTVAGGAGWAQKITPEIMKPLLGKRVVFIPDNDEPGVKFMGYASAAFLKAGARPVETGWLLLEGLPVKGDVSDWLASGHTVEELLTLVALQDDGAEYHPVYDILTSPRPPRPLVPTGYRDLDALFSGGLRAGQLWIVAARPGVGKSSLATGCAYRVALSGRKVALYSLEMDEEEVAGRINAHGPVSVEERVFIDDTGNLSIGALIERFDRMWSAEGGVDLLIVDYIQLMDGGKGAGNRVQDMGSITRGLKVLAKERDIPVIALCQLNREIEHSDTREFKLSHLRESGDIEQNADIVTFIDREELYDEASVRRGVATLHTKKQRGGPLGVVPLGYDAPSTSFYDLQLAPDTHPGGMGGNSPVRLPDPGDDGGAGGYLPGLQPEIDPWDADDRSEIRRTA